MNTPSTDAGIIGTEVTLEELPLLYTLPESLRVRNYDRLKTTKMKNKLS